MCFNRSGERTQRREASLCESEARSDGRLERSFSPDSWCGDVFSEISRKHGRGAGSRDESSEHARAWPVAIAEMIGRRIGVGPQDLEREVGRFVEYYNHQRAHAPLGNLTPADV